MTLTHPVRDTLKRFVFLASLSVASWELYDNDLLYACVLLCALSLYISVMFMTRSLKNVVSWISRHLTKNTIAIYSTIYCKQSLNTNNVKILYD